MKRTAIAAVLITLAAGCAGTAEQHFHQSVGRPAAARQGSVEARETGGQTGSNRLGGHPRRGHAPDRTARPIEQGGQGLDSTVRGDVGPGGRTRCCCVCWNLILRRRPR